MLISVVVQGENVFKKDLFNAATSGSSLASQEES
jgi:hypothetical protein